MQKEVRFSELCQYKVQRVRSIPAWDDLANGYKPSQVADYWRKMIATSPDYDDSQEQFAVIFLTGQQKIFGHALVSKGSGTQVESDPCCTFRAAIMALAPIIVIAHNHPQDSPKPSHADCMIYIRLKAAAKLVGLRLLDAMVIGEPCADYPGGWACISKEPHMKEIAKEFIEGCVATGVIPKAEAQQLIPELATESGNTDALDQLMAYEAGELDNEQVVRLFQALIDSGLAWKLQGHYGRQAAAFIKSGLCHAKQKPGAALDGCSPVWMYGAKCANSHSQPPWQSILAALGDVPMRVLVQIMEPINLPPSKRLEGFKTTLAPYAKQLEAQGTSVDAMAQDIYASSLRFDKAMERHFEPEPDSWSFSNNARQQVAEMVERICQCADPQCPVCAGKCERHSSVTLWRVDCRPPYVRVKMCEQCAEDVDKAVYRQSDQVHDPECPHCQNIGPAEDSWNDDPPVPAGWRKVELGELLTRAQVDELQRIYHQPGEMSEKTNKAAEYLATLPKLKEKEVNPRFLAYVLETLVTEGILKNDTGTDYKAPTEEQTREAAKQGKAICLQCGHVQEPTATTPRKPTKKPQRCKACEGESVYLASAVIGEFDRRKESLAIIARIKQRLDEIEEAICKNSGPIAAVEVVEPECLDGESFEGKLTPDKLGEDCMFHPFTAHGIVHFFRLDGGKPVQVKASSENLFSDDWDRVRRRTCPKCGRPKPLNPKQRKALHKHLFAVGVRTCLILGLLAIAFGFHNSWREGVAFGVMDLAIGPITESLWGTI